MPRRSLKGSTKAPAEEVYEMEDVVDYKVDEKGVERFLVKWKGYPSSQNTWEPEGNILEPSAAMKSKMTQLRAAAKEAEKPKPAAPKAVSKTKARATPHGTTKTTSTVAAAAAASSQQQQKTTPIPASSASKAAAPENRGTKRKPPQPESSADREDSSVEMSHKIPEGKVAVWHMGRGPEESVEEYKVTLRWENGYQVMRSVSYVREKYPEALLDYLLSRVRFRK